MNGDFVLCFVVYGYWIMFVVVYDYRFYYWEGYVLLVFVYCDFGSVYVVLIVVFLIIFGYMFVGFG